MPNVTKQIKGEIEEFRALLGDSPIDQVRNGTWFTTVVRRVLDVHARNVNADYFRRKYPGLDQKRIAQRLVRSSAQHMGVAGGVAGAAASAAEMSTAMTGGATAAAFVGTLLSEIAYITYHQLRLVYDVSVVLDADLDREDPEDIMTVFWYSLGVNFWEEVSNAVLLALPRGAAYLGRKALRTGVRRAMVNVAAKFGGTVLARKVTERALVKLIVPGVSIPLAASVNYAFTKKLGRTAIRRLGHRGAMVKPLRALERSGRDAQIAVIPTVFHVGIAEASEKVDGKVIEMQAVATRRLRLDAAETTEVKRLTDGDFSELVEFVRDIGPDVADPLTDVAVYAYLLGEGELGKLNLLAEAVGQSDLDGRVKRASKVLDL